MSAQARAITVLYDGTEPSERALDAAAKLAGYGSTLTVVGVSPNSDDLAGSVRTQLARRQLVARYVDASDGAALNRLASDLVVVARGSSAAALLDDAAEPDADVLLVR